jgi:uncharacterized protein (TIGR02271 family)
MSARKRNPKKQAHSEQASDRPSNAAADTGTSKEHVVVPLLEETLRAEKQWAEAGVVQLHKTVETRTETVPIDLTHEQVDIQRVTVNRVLSPGEDTGPRQEGDVLIVPIVEEELVVTKRRVVREEVRIRKKLVVAQEEASDTVRSEHLAVQTTGDLEPLN